MNVSLDILLQAAITLGAGAGVYAAVRADLARLHERVNLAMQTARDAHSRIDDHFSHGRTKS